MQRLHHAYSINVYIPNLSRHISTHWLKVPKVVPLTFFQCTYLCGGHCEQHDEHHRSDPSRIMLMPQLRELSHISSFTLFQIFLRLLGWADDKCIHYVCIMYSCCFHYAPTMYSWFVFICFHIMHSHLYPPCIYILKCINISNRAADHIAIFLYIFVQLTSVFVAVSLSIGFWGRSMVVERRDRFPLRGPFLLFHVVPRCSKWMCQLMSRACGTPWNTYQMQLESNNTELYTLISMFNYPVCEHSQPSS